MPVKDIPTLIATRVDAIKGYHTQAGLAKAELDVSGGIDSAVVLLLLARALGPDNVTAVYSSIHSSEASLRRARLVAEAAGVKLVELDLSDIYDAIALEAMRGCEVAGLDTDEIVARMGDEDAVAGSLRSCLRAPIGRYLNRMTGGGIRHGTGNEDEDRWLRFYQKGGDGEVDTNPLAMLSKGEVYQLAVALGVPEEIIVALPTPDLWGVGEKHNDEEELTRLSGGVEWSYSRVDPKSGQYVRVGTIERMSRFLDEPLGEKLREQVNSLMDQPLYSHLEVPRGATFESILFTENMAPIPCKTQVEEMAVRFGITLAHVVSARKWELITRHKLNPNCPTLGSREAYLNSGTLTDTLPEV
jgi:NAD+ synthetase